MFPLIQIGPLSLQAPGLMLLLGLWIGLTFAERFAPRFRINPAQIDNLVMLVLISGILGARLSFVLQNMMAFVQSPLSLLSLNPGLMDPVGGLAVGLVAVLIYTNRKQIPLWPMLDTLSPFLSVMWIAVGLSNLASGKAFGMETQVPWGIELWGAARHPTQIYQILAGFGILGIIWFYSEKSSLEKSVPGETLWLFLALSSAAWMVIETFRGDSVLLPGGFRSAQVVAWFVLALSLWGFGRSNKKLNPERKSL